jgi:alkanesulfonate monooxygenase SsuD/methylene tetrahydromethanopterin reductase-like flavin-dependent oxidoreductase (luciferase family)
MVQEAGRDPQSVTVRSPGRVTVTREVDKARQESKAHVAFYVTQMGDFYREQLIRLGYEADVQGIRRAWDDGGRAAGTAAVPDALVDSLLFAGPVEACRERLAILEAAGVDMMSVHVDSPEPRETIKIFQQLQA